MSDTDSSEKKSFLGLKKLLFSEEYLEQTSEQKSPAQNANAAPAASTSVAYTPTSSGSVQKDVLDKVYALLDSMNKPGIDFMELWDAAEAMGGVNETNIKSAYTALKIASGNVITKNDMVQSAHFYNSQLTTKLNEDVASKKRELDTLTAQRSSEMESLQNREKSLREQIQKMQNELTETSNALNALDNKFAPRQQEIQQKIQSGQNAVAQVSAEILNVLNIVEKSINQ